MLVEMAFMSSHSNNWDFELSAILGFTEVRFPCTLGRTSGEKIVSDFWMFVWLHLALLSFDFSQEYF